MLLYHLFILLNIIYYNTISLETNYNLIIKYFLFTNNKIISIVQYD